jgi:flavin reductase (DIM6/NTAB) family NADH-FMN oxidoreductase RutF
MSLLAGTVAVITAGSGEHRRGLTATAVCSVAVQPPTMLVCVNRYGEAHRAISEAGSYCVNLLSEMDQPVADSFAGRSGKAGADKFSDAEWIAMQSGAPALASAMVSLDCEVVEAVEAHTHTVFFGAVRAIHRGKGSAPLLHFGRRYRNLSLT